MVAPNVWKLVSENDWKKNGVEIFSETKFGNKNGNEGDENDYFLKGFVAGYRKEKDRIHRLKQEENMRKKYEVKKREKD